MLNSSIVISPFVFSFSGKVNGSSENLSHFFIDFKCQITPTLLVILQKIRYTDLGHLIKMLEEKTDGYAILRFHQEKQPMVLDLKRFRVATPRILEKYQLPADRSRAYRKQK